MLEHFIKPRDLINWLLDQREERGEAFYEEIDLESVLSIAELKDSNRQDSHQGFSITKTNNLPLLNLSGFMPD